ncbi:MAG: hypothetical protein ACE5JG_03295 [Planctomycetota bacterium]
MKARRLVGWIAATAPLLAPGCATRTVPEEVPPEAGNPRVVSAADFEVGRVMEAAPGDGDAPSLAFEVGRARDERPARLAHDLDAGRTWLWVRDPWGLSCFGRELLAGETVFVPDEISVSFAQAVGPRRGAAEPALLRLEGSIGAEEVAGFLKPAESMALVPPGLTDIESVDLRLLLGHGIDVLLSMAGPGQGGSTRLDTRAWMTVLDAEGEAADWLQELEQAHAAQNLTALGRYHVLVRRWRPQASPRAVYFRVPLGLVVVAAHMVVTAEGEGFRWVWEGIWGGQMRPPPGPVRPVEWKRRPALVLHYTEYRPQTTSGAPGAVWRTLLRPVALTADVGSAMARGQPLFKKKQD